MGVSGLTQQRRSSRMVNGERRERVVVYLSVEQAQLLRMRADNLGISMSRVLVDSAFRQVECGEIDAGSLRESVVLLREYRRKLEGMATNLNQVAKHANTVSQVPADFGVVVEAVNQLVDEVNALLVKVRV